MPFDNTPYFKARTKLLTARHGQNDHRSIPSEASHFLSARESYLHYSNSLKQLARNLLEFHQLVRTKQPGYLSFNSPFTHTTDKERDKFDADSEKALKQMNTLISSTSQAIESDKELRKLPQGHEHLNRAANLVRQQLKFLANQITTMRKSRLKHVTYRRTFGSLRGLTEHAKSRGIEVESLNSNQMRRELEPSGDNGDSSWERNISDNETSALLDNEERDTWTWNDDTTSAKTEASHSKKKDESTVLRKRKQQDNWLESEEKPDFPDTQDLNEKERTQLTMENEQLYARFAQANVEIDHLETQITEIQHLQSTFAERLLEQERDIEHVHEIAVHTTENLRDGNEWIREAISDSAGRRVIVLFCIIVITFALLFIDWYNP